MDTWAVILLQITTIMFVLVIGGVVLEEMSKLRELVLEQFSEKNKEGLKDGDEKDMI